MKLFIYPNTTAERYIEKLRKVIEKLQKEHECYIAQEEAVKIYGTSRNFKSDIAECDAVVSLGGDGTFLRAVPLSMEYGLPICGINCGNLGALCALRWDEDFDFENLHTVKLPLLETEKEGKKHYAVNDFLVGKDYFGGTIKLQVSVNGRQLYSFIGDGLIISTPIGSSGYCRSAGGTVMDTECGKIEIVPICSANKEALPAIIDENDIVNVSLENRMYRASVYGDGILIGNFEEASFHLSSKTVTYLK